MRSTSEVASGPLGFPVMSKQVRRDWRKLPRGPVHILDLKFVTPQGNLLEIHDFNSLPPDITNRFLKLFQDICKTPDNEILPATRPVTETRS